jgi:hypothetical protein
MGAVVQSANMFGIGVADDNIRRSEL